MEYFCYPHSAGFVIFGRACTQEEVEAGGDSWRATDYRQNKGYIFGEWFSIACVEGELGSNHASRCFPISEEEFNFVKARDWNVVAYN